MCSTQDLLTIAGRSQVNKPIVRFTNVMGPFAACAWDPHIQDPEALSLFAISLVSWNTRTLGDLMLMGVHLTGVEASQAISADCRIFQGRAVQAASNIAHVHATVTRIGARVSISGPANQQQMIAQPVYCCSGGHA